MKLSVIIPCYNLGRYIDEAIDSVLKQSFQDFEIIVIDDGSPEEETQKILAEIKNPKVKVIRTTNQGLSSARNNGIKEARGEYICCLDSDDRIDPLCFEKALKVFDIDYEKKVGFVTPWVQLFENSSEIWKTSDYNPGKLALHNEVAVASIFRKEAWEKVGGYNPNMKEGYEDWNFWIAICGKGYRWEVVQEPLFFYRVRDNSMISKSRLHHDKLYKQIIINNQDFFYNHLPEIVAELKKEGKPKSGGSRKVLFKHAMAVLKKNGLIFFLKKVLNYLKNPNIYIGLNNFIEDWFNDVNKKNSGKNFLTETVNKKNILFIIPGTSTSGGIAVILRHANMLKNKGYNVLIVSQDGKDRIDWFPDQNVEIIPWQEDLAPIFSVFNFVIATSWTTAPFLDKLDIKNKIYFVQSDERRFTPDVHTKNIINKTYEMRVRYMTEAYWIQRWLKEEFGHDAHYVPNGIDLDIFHKTDPIEPKGEKTRILVEGAINVPFKGMADVYDAIKDLDCEIWIVSNDGRPKKGWRFDKFFEKVPFEKMKEIYSSCDIFLKMSRVEGFFGPPMEAMACGCAVVVGKVTGYDEYIEHEKNALVVEMGDTAGAKKAIQRIIDSEDLREKLIKNGHETVTKWSWDRSFEHLEKILK